MDVNGVATPLGRINPQSASFAQNLGRHVINASARALVNTAVHGGSLEDNLTQGIVDAFIAAGAASGAYEIGQWTSPGIDPATGALTPPALDRFAGEVAHAIVGCAAGATRTRNGDGCAPGAVGAVAGHLAARFVNPTGDPSRAAETLAWSQVMSGVAGAIVGKDAQSVYVAAGTGGNAVENNYLTSQQWRNFANDLDACKTKAAGCSAGEEGVIRDRYQTLSTQQNVALANCDAIGNCATLRDEVAGGTRTMLELAGYGRLPGGGAVANDLGQYVGQRLASDPDYREQVNHSIAVLSACRAKSAECTPLPEGMYTIGTTYSLPFVGSVRFGAGFSYTVGELDIGFSIDNDVMGINAGHYYLSRGVLDFAYQKGDFRTNNGDTSTVYRMGAGGYGLSILRGPQSVMGGSFSLGSQIGISVSGQETRTWSLRGNILPILD